MPEQKVYTFKCPEAMQHAVQGIMHERNLDRTSVIKLALYMLVSYMNKEQTRKLSLHEVVAELERQAPPHYPSYAHFSMPPEPPRTAARTTAGTK